MSYLMVFLGGGAGSLLRYIIFRSLVPTHAFPFPALIVNVVSSFLLGIIMGVFLLKGSFNEHIRLLLTIGFCGGFSTFSAFSYDNYMLLTSGHWIMAFLNISLSILICLAAITGGMALSKII